MLRYLLPVLVIVVLAVVVAVVVVPRIAGRWATETDEAAERANDDTDEFPPADEPDRDGWSAQQGWDYQAIWNAIVDGYDPTPCEPAIYDELGGIPELEMAA